MRRTDRTKDHKWESVGNNNQHRCTKCGCIRTRTMNKFTFQKNGSEVFTDYIECEN